MTYDPNFISNMHNERLCWLEMKLTETHARICDIEKHVGLNPMEQFKKHEIKVPAGTPAPQKKVVEVLDET